MTNQQSKPVTNLEASAQRLVGTLRERLGDALQAVTLPHLDTVLATVDPAGLTAAARCLFEEVGARYLIAVGTDRRCLTGDFGVSHIFSIDAEHLYAVVECAVGETAPRVDSITPLVPGANWAERELFDTVGVAVEGHPDPRRLLLADDWPEGVFPLRRDFRFDEQPPPKRGAEPRPLEPPEGATVIPLGPFFPTLEEPSYWRLFVDGETIVGCDYRGFYNHRGIEKLGDSSLTYNEIPYVAERICGICGFIHSSAYCQAVERAAGVEAPARARYIRTLMLELERIHSHLLWLGIAAHIIGFDTVLMQTWRMREPIMWLCEEISGNRKTYGMNTIGGVRRDFPARLELKLDGILDEVEREARAVAKAIADDTTLWARTRGVGVLDADWARKVCVVGPPARASGLAIDARVDHAYAAYDEIGVKVAVEQGGDTWARVLVRLAELLESIRLVRETVRRMPPGPLCAEVGCEIPPGRIGISVVEAPRGEAIHVVFTGGDNRPYRWRVRAPTYPNLQAAPAMLASQSIADVPIIVGSLDPCFSCTERFETVDIHTQRVDVYSGDELARWSRLGGGGRP